MKQKFLLLKNEVNNELIIKEFSELDAGMYTLICEETYNIESIRSVITDKHLLTVAIRNNSLFPISHIMDKIFELLPDLLGSKEKESVEFFFEDMEMISDITRKIELEEEIDDDVGIDSLLEVDDDDLDEKTADPIDSSIEQISIDSSVDDLDDA